MPRETRLVVVDHSLDTRDVLRAVFQPRGVNVERRARPSESSPSELTPREAAPETDDVFILDEDSCPNGWFQSWPGPRVVIGTVNLPPAGEAEDAYLRKPFHYAELIRAVERLLESVEQQPRRAA